VQDLQVEQEAIAQMAHGPGAQLDLAFAKKLVLDLIALHSPQVARQADMHDKVVTVSLTRPNKPRERLGFHHRMR
jgi:hypothetical protein